jgi:outer membrane lipoprotein LolB
MMRFFKHAAATGLVLLAAGCASLPPQDGKDNGPALERRYSDAIDLGGRLSVRYEQNGREEAVHGSFTWNQSTRHVVVTLLSPLGQTMATIDIKPGVAVLTQSGKPPMTATDVDILTEQALGWPLPISGLRDWLQGFGRGADGKLFVVQPAADTVRQTTRDGWSLSYGEWQEGAANTASNHPKRIDLARETKQAGPVAIRIVIDSWKAAGAQ